MIARYSQVLAALEAARSATEIGDHPAVLRVVQALPEEAHDMEPELGCLLAWAQRNTGAAEEAERALRRVEELTSARGNDPVNRMRLHIQGFLHLDRGGLDPAERTWALLLEHASEAEDQRRVSRACNNLGIVADIRRQFADAIAWYERALAASHRVGDAEGVASAQNNIAISYRQMGLLDKALDVNDQALRLLDSTGHGPLTAAAELARAWILLDLSELSTAESMATRAQARFERLGMAGQEADVLCLLGNLRAVEGRLEEARALLTQALQVAERFKSPLRIAEAWEDLAEIHHRCSDRERADLAAAEARRLYLEMGAAARAERTVSRVTIAQNPL